MRAKLRADEKILLIAKKGRVVIYIPFFWFTVFILIGLAVPPLLIIAFIAFCVFIREFARRRRDIWIITNQRVIDESGVFTHQAKESPLDKINNVSYSQSYMNRQWGVGTVELQTAASLGMKTFVNAFNPRKIVETVVKAQEDYGDTRFARQAKGFVQSVTGAVASGNTIDGGTKECPYCAEIIKIKAKICRFCNRDIVG